MGADESAAAAEARARRLVVGGVGLMGVVVLVGLVVVLVGLPVSSACGQAPGPAFGFQEHDGVRGTDVTVTLESGEVRTAGNLHLVTPRLDATWATLSANRGPGDIVSPGDTVTLTGLEPGTVIEVGWRDRQFEPDGGDEQVSECGQASFDRQLATYTVKGVNTAAGS